MDSTVAAGWIGFGGAFIGGGMAWLGGWLTMRSQSKKDMEARRLDRLDEAVAQMSDAGVRVALMITAEELDSSAVAALAHWGRVVQSRAHGAGETHLAQILQEFLLTLAQDSDETQKEQVRRYLTWNRALVNIANAWIADRVSFEEEKRSLQWWITKTQKSEAL